MTIHYIYIQLWEQKDDVGNIVLVFGVVCAYNY